MPHSGSPTHTQCNSHVQSCLEWLYSAVFSCAPHPPLLLLGDRLEAEHASAYLTVAT